mgnify:CR=1
MGFDIPAHTIAALLGDTTCRQWHKMPCPGEPECDWQGGKHFHALVCRVGSDGVLYQVPWRYL